MKQTGKIPPVQFGRTNLEIRTAPIVTCRDCGKSEGTSTAQKLLGDLEQLPDLELHDVWMAVLRSIDMIRNKKELARCYWVGFGSKPETLRSGLIAFRDATSHESREEALLTIVDEYDAEVKKNEI